MSKAFVLDCSVTLSWFFADEFSPVGHSVFDALGAGARAWVPSLWHLEVVNSFAMAQRKGRIGAEGFDYALGQLNSFAISTDDETVFRAWTSTRRLAEQHKLTAYDAAYLELALRRQLPLATFDNALLAAAKATGAALLLPA
jgi:predicted nucleic acid-binding protein